MPARTDIAHWRRLWNDLEACGDRSSTWHARLVAAYSESTRAYHNLSHLEECLIEFDRVGSNLSDPSAVEAALWFHDVVYDPRSTTNEEDSAAAAAVCLAEAGIPSTTIDLVVSVRPSTSRSTLDGVRDVIATAATDAEP
jgi:predicted metal-dependent HD superfamily phosphohydrolase